MADISYSKINWKNEPSHNTPLSAQNLNKMDTAIYDLVTKSNSLVPNPDESPTEGLEKLEYDGTVYEVKGGHKILNDSGSVLTQMDNMQFNGVYTHNASTITEVDIVREFSTVAEIEALTGEAKKGFEVIEDNEEYIPYTGSDILFDNTDTSFEGENVQEVLEEVDTALDVLDNKIKFDNLTGTTNNNGSIVIPNNRKIIHALIKGGVSYTYRLGNAGSVTYIHIMDELGNAIASTNVDIDYYYLNI